MPCKCNSTFRDPECTISHVWPAGWAGQEMTMQERIKEAYAALDALLEGMGRLPINQITTRPPLHQAFIRGLKVIDEAVKEGRYVVPSDE